MARVAMVAGMDRNQLIGKDNGLPWHIPEDMRRFVRVTRGKSVIMGRLTYESIGKPLPDRDNHVITRNPVFVAPGCTVHDSLTSALSGTAHEEEVVIMGGAQIYAEALPLANYLYLTIIEAEFDGDTWFPEWNANEWREVWEEQHHDGGADNLTYRFVNLARVT